MLEIYSGDGKSALTRLKSLNLTNLEEGAKDFTSYGSIALIMYYTVFGMII